MMSFQLFQALYGIKLLGINISNCGPKKRRTFSAFTCSKAGKPTQDSEATREQNVMSFNDDIRLLNNLAPSNRLLAYELSFFTSNI